MQHSQSAPGVKTGAHTQFKDALRQEMHGKVQQTIRVRSGPSWDERMEKAMKGFKAERVKTETEMKKNLSEAIERGRSRETSAPHRDSALAPDGAAMLMARKKRMAELETEYREQLDALRDKMEKREPLFRLSDVNAAFAMQRERMIERKRQMRQDESERWEHLRELELNAANRPLVIEDPSYKPPKKTFAAPADTAAATGKDAATQQQTVHKNHNPAVFGGREEYEKDAKIREAVNSKWYNQTEWARQVRDIRERADNRQKLHEIQYPNKGDRHALTRNRLMHTLPSQVPGVY